MYTATFHVPRIKCRVSPVGSDLLGPLLVPDCLFPTFGALMSVAAQQAIGVVDVDV